MKTLNLLFVLLSFISLKCLGQKPVIDTNATNNWKYVNSGRLSGNGKFFCYELLNHQNVKGTLVFKATRTVKPIAEIPGGTTGNFGANDEIAIFRKGYDSLGFFNLKNGKTEYFSSVSDYKLSPDKCWVVYQKLEAGQAVVHLRNLQSSAEEIFSNVIEYRFTKKNRFLLLQREAGLDRMSILAIQSKRLLTIWEGKNSSDYQFSKDGDKVAFIAADEKNNISQKSTIWYYDGQWRAARKIWDNSSEKLIPGNHLAGIGNFSTDGTGLFVRLTGERPVVPAKKAIPKVDVWSYTDVILQSEQLALLPKDASPEFLARLDVVTHKMMQIQGRGELLDNAGQYSDKFMIKTIFKDFLTTEGYWNKLTSSTKTCLIDTKANREIKNIGRTYRAMITPDEKYFLYIDRNLQNCYAYELASGITRNLTADLPIPKIDTTVEESPATRGELRGYMYWLPGAGYLIGDKYDIWLVDPSGKKAGRNLTNGYGRKHNVIFDLADPSERINVKKLLLSALDIKTKNMGFFETDISNQADPRLLSIGPYNYRLIRWPPDEPSYDKHGQWYLVVRESASSSGNYYITSDFRNFKKLTNFYPESQYNWMTSELINFKSSDGHPLQAAIYKPENFDPAKKYPVIIHYYENLSAGVNEFHDPDLFGDNINIPWFVSRGYIVVTPDIHYTIGEPGKSALNAVVGVANYLKSLAYIDSLKMGIQGHSWGGYETNYIVTHSKLFAAAMSACGQTDIQSFALGLFLGKESAQSYTETGQGRMGKSIWQNPNIYISNSPVLRADSVITPLLLMYNKLDLSSFPQGIEFFTALRRLGKRSWMLQYDGEGHTVDDRQAKLDYTIRVQQFFDHYLKGLPAPVWMTRGIPASLKGTTDGFEYDKEIKTPPPSPLIDPNKDPKIIYDNNN